MWLTDLLSELKDRNILNQFDTFIAPAGSAILLQGEPADQVYILATGQALVCLLFPDGKLATLFRGGAGDVFGEAELICMRNIVTTVYAETQCTGYCLPRSAFLVLLQRENWLCFQLLCTAEERSLDRITQLLQRGRQTSTQKVAQFLLESAGSAVRVPVTKQSIANVLQISVRSVHRALQQMQQQGLIINNSQQVQIINRPALCALLLT